MRFIFLLSLFASISGCTSFAPEGNGGLAEHYPQASFSAVMPDEPIGPEHGLRFEWELAARHLDVLILEQAEWCFPATVYHAKNNEARIARELEGGLEYDAANDLIIQRKLLRRLENQLDYVLSKEDCVPPGSNQKSKKEVDLATRLYDLLNADNQFAFNSYELSPKYIGRLAEASHLLKQNPEFKLLVTGHADSVGKESYNTDLAMERAKQVKRYLSIFGLEPQRIHVDSVGTADPLFEGSEPHVRLTNRRVTIELLQAEQILPAEMNNE